MTHLVYNNAVLILRSLNPQTEQHLFEIAYNWRRHPRRNRMSFEDFAKDDPSQIVLGLFNGELQAVYLFCQISSTEFEAHFSSSRKAKREDVLAGARQMVEWFSQNGLVVVGYVQSRNTPLKRFLEEAGLILQTAANPRESSLFLVYRSPSSSRVHQVKYNH